MAARLRRLLSAPIVSGGRQLYNRALLEDWRGHHIL